MADRIEAVYDNGVFRPLAPVVLPEGQPVTVEVVSQEKRERAKYITALAGRVYEGLTEEEIDAVEREFRRPDAWSPAQEP